MWLVSQECWPASGWSAGRHGGAPDHARSQVAGLVGGQAGPGGEAAQGPPHVGGEQPPAGPGGEQRLAGGWRAAGEVGVDPGRGRAGQRQVLAPAVGAGDPQHPAPAAGPEVGDVGAGHLAEAGADEQQDGGQRRGAGTLRAGRGVGRVDEREDLAAGEGRGGRSVRAGPGPGDAGGGAGGDVPAPGQPGVPARDGGELAGRAGRGQPGGLQLPGVPGHVQCGDAGHRVHSLLPAPGEPGRRAAGPLLRGDADVAGVAGPGVLRPPGGQPGGHQKGHRIGVGGRGDQHRSRGLAAAHHRILSPIILDNRDYRGFVGPLVHRSSRRSAVIPQLPLSARSQYCTVVAEQSGHFCSVRTQLSDSG